MHIYNVTLNIEEAVHDEWLKWMKEEYIPAMLATGKFTQALMSRVLVEEEMGGITYSVQYQTPSMQVLQQYFREDQPRMHQKLAKYQGKVVFFSTAMKVIAQQ